MEPAGEPIDVADVPLQGAYVARRCPVRADLDHARGLATVPVPASQAAQARRDAGLAFEAEVLAAVAGLPTTVVVAAADRATAQAATAAALGGPGSAIVGAWLPDDPVGRRAGRPDLLVRDRAGGWVPVDVKGHGLTRPHKPGSTLLRSPLDRLDPDAAEVVDEVRLRTRAAADDGLQLAHYWRLLEAAGHAGAAGPRGGIVDRTGVVWWLDLAEERWTGPGSEEPVSLLARYDRAFGLRLEAIAARLAHDRDPSVPLRVEPVWVGECTTCPWQLRCRAELEAVDHVSLLPGSTWWRFVQHRDLGTTTRAEVAALDLPTARLLHGPDRKSRPLDLAAVLAAAEGAPPDAPIDELVPAGPDGAPARRRLAEAGIARVADLAMVDPATARYSGADVGHLPSVIDEARAAVADRPFRRRGLDRITVTRADVEVDVDMENVEGGTYLWGTQLTVRSAVGAAVGEAEGYRPFHSWEPITASTGGAVSADVFERFWTWLQDVRRRCHEVGASFAAYCYTSAEEHQMRHTIVAAPDGWTGPTQAEVDAFTATDEWVDLYAVVRSSVEVGHGRGLKKIAPLAGFTWRDDDPGGDQSMVWHAIATTDPEPAVRETFRTRLLAYNEDDVLATLAVRGWLAEDPLPPIESWTPDPPGRGR